MTEGDARILDKIRFRKGHRIPADRVAQIIEHHDARYKMPRWIVSGKVAPPFGMPHPDVECQSGHNQKRRYDSCKLPQGRMRERLILRYRGNAVLRDVFQAFYSQPAEHSVYITMPE